VYLKSVSRTSIFSFGVARAKKTSLLPILDHTAKSMIGTHLSFLALILAHAVPVVSGKFCKKKLDIFTKIITLIRAFSKQAIRFPGCV
jgi:hypothetical protein